MIKCYLLQLTILVSAVCSSTQFLTRTVQTVKVESFDFLSLSSPLPAPGRQAGAWWGLGWGGAVQSYRYTRCGRSTKLCARHSQGLDPNGIQGGLERASPVTAVRPPQAELTI